MEQDPSPDRIAHLILHILFLENSKCDLDLGMTWGRVGGWGGAGLQCAKYSSNQRRINSVIRLGNNKVLKT